MVEPKVRFKDNSQQPFPNWKEFSLKDCCDFIRNGYAYESDGLRTHKNKITRIETISSGVINCNKLGSTEEAIPVRYMLEDGDILFSHINSLPYLGNTAIYTEELGHIYHGMNLLCIRANRNVVDPYYLLMLLRSSRTRAWILANAKRAVNQCSIPSSDVEKYKIVIPESLEEQKKVADFLRTVDDIISYSDKEIANLEEQKKVVMNKLFSQDVRFVSTAGKMFSDWVEKPIRMFAQCIAGATPSTKVKEYWENGTIPWMSSGEVNKGLVFDTDAKITQLGYDKTSTKMIPPETVVMALAGQGKTRGTVAYTKIALCTNQSLCSIVVDKSVDSRYLYQYLKTQYQNLRQISSGDGTRGGLNLQLVGDYIVPIPCLEEQRLIANFLSDFDEAIAAAKKELELWKELKKGLLQQMFV